MAQPLASSLTQAGSGRAGLREYKKLRTRERIARVALELFAEHGYDATTLVQIADAAEIAPSTLHAYFPAKENIIFAMQDAVRWSVRARILERPAGESVVDALIAWIEGELPELADAETDEAICQRRATIDTHEGLATAERLRHALLEDDFARAFARDLGEEPHDLRPRLLASFVTNGLLTIWTWRYEEGGREHDAEELSKLDAMYVVGLAKAAEHAIQALPSPPAHAQTGSQGGDRPPMQSASAKGARGAEKRSRTTRAARKGRPRR